MPVMALVRPGPGTTLKTPTSPVARAAASAMTLADDLVGHQEVRDRPGLEGVPELVALGPRDAEHAADPLAAERGRGGLGTRHPSLDARVGVT